ncbi:MAG: glycerophosphodiester phosphodiesterase [Chryseobacterium sp.]|nr:MAG: glycerophosphodiester phosphodiesterase [Chryseobacterium sp.]
MQAHRGGAGLLPENTIIAMKDAVDREITLEMDLYFSRDKQVVVYHNSNISSVFAYDPTGKPFNQNDEAKYRLNQLDYATIRKFEIGLKPTSIFPEQKKVSAYIPLLDELIDSVENYAKAKKLKAPAYNIEAKLPLPSDDLEPSFRTAFMAEVMKIVSARKIGKRTMVQSFDVGMLEALHKTHPAIQTSYLVDQVSLLNDLKKLSFKPSIYSPNYKNVTKELVEKCHQLGIKIIPWTPNTKEEMRALKAMGVDGLITDYPNLF